MTLKGKVFDPIADLPRKCRWSPERRQAWCDEMTQRYAIVAYDNGEPVIAEERSERILLRLSEAGRPMAQMLLGLSDADRVAVLSAFDMDGQLVDVLDPA